MHWTVGFQVVFLFISHNVRCSSCWVHSLTLWSTREKNTSSVLFCSKQQCDNSCVKAYPHFYEQILISFIFCKNMWSFQTETSKKNLKAKQMPDLFKNCILFLQSTEAPCNNTCKTSFRWTTGQTPLLDHALFVVQ